MHKLLLYNQHFFKIEVSSEQIPQIDPNILEEALISLKNLIEFENKLLRDNSFTHTDASEILKKKKDIATFMEIQLPMIISYISSINKISENQSNKIDNEQAIKNKNIVKLISELLSDLENNMSLISQRCSLNEQLIDAISKVTKRQIEQEKLSYKPQNSTKSIHENQRCIVFNEEA